MNSKYNDIFNTLIKAYYNDTFDETLNRIITCHEVSPQDTFDVITSLCGVEINFNNNYLYNIKKAIKNYIISNNIIKKSGNCIYNCSIDNNGKHICEVVCPYDAIKYDNLTRNTYIDCDLCDNCGKCVDVCRSGHILDIVEYIPILNLIKEGKTIIAIVDPSIILQFGPNVSIGKLRSAFKKIGFSDVFVSKSTILETGNIIRKIKQDAKIVFVSPNISEKMEYLKKDNKNVIDFVLTFEELNEILYTFNIVPEYLEPTPTTSYMFK